MFVNNVIAYKFKQEVNYSQEEFEQALQQDKATPIGESQLTTTGWSNVFGKHIDTLSCFEGDIIAIRKKDTERVVSGPALNQATQEKVDVIEKAENRPVKKKERDEIKENILHMHLPYALPKSTYTEGYIDTKNGILVVNAKSFNKAEEFLALLRKSLGSLPVVPMWINFDLNIILTRIFDGSYSIPNMAIGYDAKLIGLDKEVETFKNTDLSTERIRNAVNDDLTVKEISLDYNEQLKFKLFDSGEIKNVTFSELIKEENADIPKEDMLVKYRADLVLTTSIVRELLVALEKAFIDVLGDPNASL